MKLLLDHNLSHKLVAKLADLFPESTQTRLLGFGRMRDTELWFYARTHGFMFVTKDRDIVEIAILRGAPPKVIWLRMGNCTAPVVEKARVKVIGYVLLAIVEEWKTSVFDS